MSIRIENLSYVYMKGSPFEKTALNNISLNIENGEFVGIIGHTGSGKSTLIQHLNGLLKPTSGKVFINSVDTCSRNLKELRREVGIVFQYPEHQLFEETVFKDVAFGLQKLGLSPGETEKRVLNALHCVGLKDDILQKSPFEISGGQKRRVAMAGVLVMEPRILILDEPTAGLDPKGRDEIFGYIKALHNRAGNTIILVSHSMEDIARLAQRVIVMNRSSIDMDAPTAEVFKKTKRLETIGLSAPQITYLMKKLKAVVPNLNTDVFTIEDAKAELMKYLRLERRT